MRAETPGVAGAAARDVGRLPTAAPAGSRPVTALPKLTTRTCSTPTQGRPGYAGTTTRHEQMAGAMGGRCCGSRHSTPTRGPRASPTAPRSLVSAMPLVSAADAGGARGLGSRPYGNGTEGINVTVGGQRNGRVHHAQAVPAGVTECGVAVGPPENVVSSAVHHPARPGAGDGAAGEEGTGVLRVAGRWVLVAMLRSGVIAVSTANAAAAVRNTAARTGRPASPRPDLPVVREAVVRGEVGERVSTSPMTTARTPTANMCWCLVVAPRGHGEPTVSDPPEPAHGYPLCRARPRSRVRSTRVSGGVRASRVPAVQDRRGWLR